MENYDNLIIEYLQSNKPEIIKYNLNRIYIAHNNGITENFFKPFVFEENETKIVDITTNIEYQVRDVTHSYKSNIEKTLQRIYYPEFGEIEELEFENAAKMIDAFVLFPKGKEFRDVILEMFFDSDEDELIGGSAMNDVRISAKGMIPVLGQVREGVLQRRKEKLEELQKMDLEIEDFNRVEFGEMEN